METTLGYRQGFYGLIADGWTDARHLGIYDTAWGPTRGSIAVLATPAQSSRGWGFGNRAFLDDVQGYSWAGVPVGKTAFEIAVKLGPLTAEESKRLLKKKK